jgi:hypothetical protein
MVLRDTGTGGVLEQMVLPALRRGGYQYQTRAHLGNRFGGGKHYVDIIKDAALPQIVYAGTPLKKFRRSWPHADG